VRRPLKEVKQPDQQDQDDDQEYDIFAEQRRISINTPDLRTLALRSSGALTPRLLAAAGSDDSIGHLSTYHIAAPRVKLSLPDCPETNRRR
jgi:hypothetical protein